MDRRSLLKLASTGALVSGLSGCAEGLLGQERSASQARPTLPKKIQKIAFGSCIDQNKPQPIWNAILSAKPDVFIFGGDNVYASSQLG